MRGFVAVALAAALTLVGAQKLLGSPPEGALVAGPLAVGVGVLEVLGALVLVLVPRCRAWVCYGVVLLCLIGLVVKLGYPERPCGCMGGLGGRSYFLAVGSIGLLASSWLAMGTGAPAVGSASRAGS